MLFELRCSSERDLTRNLKLISSPFDSRVHDYALETVFRTMLCINARNKVWLPQPIFNHLPIYLNLVRRCSSCSVATSKPALMASFSRLKLKSPIPSSLGRKIKSGANIAKRVSVI